MYVLKKKHTESMDPIEKLKLQRFLVILVLLILVKKFFEWLSLAIADETLIDNINDSKV